MKLPVYKTKELLGSVTNLTCRCGGSLQEVRVVVMTVPPKPTHRKKRILKKRLKAWREQAEIRQGLSFGVALMRPPAFRCTVCYSTEGFYKAMGRNLFIVQDLPSVALPIYLGSPSDD